MMLLLEGMREKLCCCCSPKNNIKHSAQAQVQNDNDSSGSSDDDGSNLDEQSPTLTTPLVLAIGVAAASQFLVGYNTGVMNPPAHVIFPGHSTLAWSMAVSAFCLGGPFGSILGQQWAEERGRRGALLINSGIFLAGGILQTAAPNMTLLIVARLIIGFASGYSSVLVPIYLNEVSPPKLQGRVGTLTQFCLVLGILAADLFSFAWATPDAWRWLFAVTPVVAQVQLLLSPLLLESPQWLRRHKPTIEQDEFLTKTTDGGDIVATEENNNTSKSSSSSQWDMLVEMWNHRGMRTLLISALVLQMGQQLSGINAVFYYSTTFFDGVIDNPLVGTTLVGGINVLATYAALLLMDHCGRKTLILWSAGGMFLSCIFVVLSLLGYFDNIISLLAVNAYVIFYEIGLGPIPWLIVAEMFSGKNVAVAMGLCSQLNWGCNFVIGLAFPYMIKYLGPYSFGPFAGVLLFVFLFAATVLPETLGKTPEALETEMTRSTSYDVPSYERKRSSFADGAPLVTVSVPVEASDAATPPRQGSSISGERAPNKVQQNYGTHDGPPDEEEWRRALQKYRSEEDISVEDNALRRV